MRARALAVLIAVFAAVPLPAQCNFSPVLSDPFRSSILDLAIDGNDLWAATGYGVALYDRSVDPPRFVATVAVPGLTREIRVAAGTVYAASGNSIAVVRKNGSALQLVRTIDAGAPVNDLAVGSALYVATSGGIAQYNLLDFSRTQVTTGAVSSLALSGSNLYAASGATSIDVYSTTPILNRTGSISTPANVTAVHVDNGVIYASTSVQTTLIVVNNVTTATLPFAMSSVAPVASDVILTGGGREIAIIDTSTSATPVDLFSDELPTSAGSINRVGAVAVAGGRAYIGAGDSGIVEYDISGFAAPFPLRCITLLGPTSVVSLGDTFYVGLGNGVTEFSQALEQKRSWDGSRADVVQDGDNGFLLTSSGNSITLWALNTLTQVATVTLAAPVTDAALFGTKAIAVLSDSSVWSADMSQAAPVPSVLAGVQANSIARSGTAAALALARSDATTAITLMGGGTFTVPGLATTGVTLSGTIAAVQTFRGITLIDLTTGTTTLLPQSNDIIAQQLLLSGNTLFEVGSTSLRVWNTQSETITAAVELPSPPLAVSITPDSTTADVATSGGVATVALDRLAHLPVVVPTANANAFYKKVIASTTRIGLVDARGVDLFTPLMQYIGSVRGAGIVDAAASDSAIYTVTAQLNLGAWSPAGTPIASASIDEPDSQALSIATVGGAPWVSLVHCGGGACDKKTIIFDNKLTRTISLTGAIVDIVTSGSRAFAITDTPAELRVLSVADPTHPSIVASVPLDSTPSSIAYSSGTIYVLGNGLAAYGEASLTKTADILTSTSSPDEHIRIDGSCAIVTGRDASPQLFTLPQFTAVNSFSTPATAHSLAAEPGVFYVLTDNSLEIWSTAPLPSPSRKPAAR